MKAVTRPIILVLLLLAVLLCVEMVSAGTLVDNPLVGGDYAAVALGCGQAGPSFVDYAWAQQFVFTQDVVVTGLRIYDGDSTGSPPANLTGEIQYVGIDGKPNGTLVSAKAKKTITNYNSAVAPSIAAEDFTFDSPAFIRAGTYFFVVHGYDGCVADTFRRMPEHAFPYSGGPSYYKALAWNLRQSGTYSFPFTIFGYPAPPNDLLLTFDEGTFNETSVWDVNNLVTLEKIVPSAGMFNVTGLNGTGFYMNQSGQYREFNSTISESFNANNGFGEKTTVCYARKSSAATDGLQVLYADSDQFAAMAFQEYGMPQRWSGYVQDAEGDYVYVETQNGFISDDGNWHYYCAVWDGGSLASSIKFYKDGIEKPRDEAADDVVGIVDAMYPQTYSNGIKLQIAMPFYNSDFYLDEIRLYANRSLSSAEIAGLAADYSLLATGTLNLTSCGLVLNNSQDLRIELQNNMSITDPSPAACILLQSGVHNNVTIDCNGYTVDDASISADMLLGFNNIVSARDLTIEDCVFNDNNLGSALVDYISYPNNISGNFTVRRSRVYSSDVWMYSPSVATNTSIVDSVFIGMSGGGIARLRGDVVTLSNNSFNSDNAAMLVLTNSGDVIINGNVFTGSALLIDGSSSIGGSLYIYNNVLNMTMVGSYVPANVFFNTTQQVGLNIIGGSQLGGNYWANAGGTGYSETCTGDGTFCTTPYDVFGDASAYDYLPLTNNMPPDVGRHYSFDDTFNDSISGKNGNNTGVTFSSDTPTLGNGTVLGGKSGFFDASSYVDVPYVSQVNYPNFTIAAWIKTTSSSLEAIVGSADESSAGSGHLLSVGSNNVGQVYSYVITNSGASSVEVESTNTVNDGAWHFIVQDFVEGVGSHIYVDGVDVTTVWMNTTLPWTEYVNGATYIGAVDNTPATPSAYFDGLIDEVRIYPRALNASEVTSLYTCNNESANCVPTTPSVTLDTPIGGATITDTTNPVFSFTLNNTGGGQDCALVIDGVDHYDELGFADGPNTFQFPNPLDKAYVSALLQQMNYDDDGNGNVVMHNWSVDCYGTATSSQETFTVNDPNYPFITRGCRPLDTAGTYSLQNDVVVATNPCFPVSSLPLFEGNGRTITSTSPGYEIFNGFIDYLVVRNAIINVTDGTAFRSSNSIWTSDLLEIYNITMNMCGASTGVYISSARSPDIVVHDSAFIMNQSTCGVYPAGYVMDFSGGNINAEVYRNTFVRDAGLQDGKVIASWKGQRNFGGAHIPSFYDNVVVGPWDVVVQLTGLGIIWPDGIYNNNVSLSGGTFFTTPTRSSAYTLNMYNNKLENANIELFATTNGVVNFYDNVLSGTSTYVSTLRQNENVYRNDFASAVSFGGTSGAKTVYDNIFRDQSQVTATAATISFNTAQTTGPNIIGGTDIGGNAWYLPNGSGYSQTCMNSNNDSFCDSAYTPDPVNLPGAQDTLPLTLNQPPTVPEITGIVCSSVDPVAHDTPAAAVMQVNFTVHDPLEFNGSSVLQNVSYNALVVNGTCGYTQTDATHREYVCNNTMHYWYEAGSYVAQVNYTNAMYSVNATGPLTCGYSALIDFKYLPTQVMFPGASPGVANVPSDAPLVVVNDGNVARNVSIIAHDLHGVSSPGNKIPADAFKAGLTLGSAVTLADGIQKDLGITVLPGQNASIWIWLSMPGTTVIQSYVTAAPWQLINS